VAVPVVWAFMAKSTIKRRTPMVERVHLPWTLYYNKMRNRLPLAALRFAALGP